MSKIELGARSVPKLIKLVNSNLQRPSTFKSELAENLCLKHKLLSLPTKCPKNPSWLGGERSYMLIGSLAKLEHALMRWSMTELIQEHQFIPVVVPNILHDRIIENCGFPTTTKRSQVYKIRGNAEPIELNEKDDSPHKPDVLNQPCLAGTSEFALAALHIGDSIDAKDLPMRYCALSRCYRAETSRTSSEWGLYRVHYFKKVEMFGFSMPDKSSELHEEFLHIQQDLFGQLGLKFQILDMPEDDLGKSASKKYDIEAWFEGRQRFGEISSTSNCSDYQSSRLNIKYSQLIERNDQLQVDSDFVHTINGTACSSIRTILAICEQHQTEDGHVIVPEPLRPYMNGIQSIPSKSDTLMQSLLKESSN